MYQKQQEKLIHNTQQEEINQLKQTVINLQTIIHNLTTENHRLKLFEEQPGSIPQTGLVVPLPQTGTS